MQNIDLFERQPPTGLASPSVRRAVLAAALGLFVCVLAWLLQTQELRSTQHDLERVQALNDHLQRALAGVPTAELVMHDKLATDEEEVHALETVVHTLSTGGLAHTTGFAASLRAFGRTSTEGVWLTGIDLDNRRGSMVVEGRALDASRLPALLQSLGTDPYFAGTSFSAIEMNAGNPDSSIPAERALRFRASTPTADVDTKPIPVQVSAPAASGQNAPNLQSATQAPGHG